MCNSVDFVSVEKHNFEENVKFINLCHFFKRFTFEISFRRNVLDASNSKKIKKDEKFEFF